MFSAIKATHGDKSEKQVIRLVREFNGQTKKTTQKFENYNAEWTEALRILESNGMDLSDKYIVNLYLISLASQYRTLDTMIQVLPAR